MVHMFLSSDQLKQYMCFSFPSVEAVHVSLFAGQLKQSVFFVSTPAKAVHVFCFQVKRFMCPASRSAEAAHAQQPVSSIDIAASLAEAAQ